MFAQFLRHRRGPIFLPKPGEGGSPIYNGRKPFLLLFLTERPAQQHTIFGGTGDPQAVPVPTVKMRVGDFSELLQPGLRVYPKAGGGTVTAQNGTISLLTARRSLERSSELSFVRRLLKLCTCLHNAFPLPNLPGAGRNYATNRKEHAIVNSYDIRIDQRLSAKNTSLDVTANRTRRVARQLLSARLLAKQQ